MSVTGSSEGERQAEGAVLEFRTVGDLRRALEGVPDDIQLMSQVAAADGSAWNLWGRVVPNVEGSGGSLAAISLTHRDLVTLPNPADLITDRRINRSCCKQFRYV